MRLLRLFRILAVCWRYGLDEILATSAATHGGASWPLRISRALRLGATPKQPRGQRLREALETLGPIFVKFGQVLSTRRDLLATDIADELARLQDKVPPFDGDTAVAEIERGMGRPIDQVFASFDKQPIASASIAQVHRGTLANGTPAAIKVLRPGMLKIIERDLALLRVIGGLVMRLSADGRRLRPLDVIDEFDTYLHDELDMLREAANASQLRRNSADSQLLIIPDIYWDYCAPNVLTMQFMQGITISHTDELLAAGIDLKRLARDGVEIFFRQVFHDGFFHADMHPGNILVGDRGEQFNRYIALDFGIVGALSETDKNYLAQNFLAFFRRDYRRVAQLHIDSGWVPETTRVEQLESAVRACCEPFFDRPLKEISLGLVLMRLFQASRRFDVRIQPQLVLLQKTLLNIEGLGRELDPDLDLWVTAKPVLERWMNQQIGLEGFLDSLKREAPHWAQSMPQIPRLVHGALALADQPGQYRQQQALTEQLIEEQRKTRRWLTIVCVLVAASLVLSVFALLR